VSAPQAAALGPIPTVRIGETSIDDVVRWTAAIDDYSPIHYDAAVAEERGFAGPVVNGPWKAALLARMLTQWLDGRGVVERLECRYQRPDVVGGPLTCRGEVVAEHERGAERLLECRLEVEGADSVVTVTGSADVRLPGAVPEPGELPVAELRRALDVGNVVGEFTYRVDPNDVAAFRAAVSADTESAGNRPSDMVVPIPGDIAPPTFYAALDPVERRDLQLEALLDAVPHPKNGGGNAFNEVVYERPIRAGDVITVRTTYQDVYERDGRRGRLLFRVRVNELRAADGTLVATTRMGHVHSFDTEATL
jgi:acyl dehydratase